MSKLPAARRFGGQLDTLIKQIGNVSTGWSLAAFAIAAVLLLMPGRKGKLISAALAAIVTLGLAPLAADVYDKAVAAKAVYRVRVIVLDAQGQPTDAAKITSDVGGEAKKVAGGWELSIPTATRPKGGQLTIYAAEPDAFLSGRTRLTLKDDLNPKATLQLGRDTTARVRGVVLDEAGQPVAGVSVSIASYDREATTTTAQGGFDLPAHAAEGQPVLVRARTSSGDAATQNVMAGPGQVTLVLSKAPNT